MKYIEINNDYKCEARVGPKNVCGEPADYILNGNNNIYFFCKKHIILRLDKLKEEEEDLLFYATNDEERKEYGDNLIKLIEEIKKITKEN